jgi:hypothetical protein
VNDQVGATVGTHTDKGGGTALLAEGFAFCDDGKGCVHLLDMPLGFVVLSLSFFRCDPSAFGAFKQPFVEALEAWQGAGELLVGDANLTGFVTDAREVDALATGNFEL